MKFLNNDTTRFEPTRTAITAIPMEKAFTIVLVTASTEHSPTNCTNTGLFLIIPSFNIFDSFNVSTSTYLVSLINN